jgi:hypothetical protein
MPRDGAITFGDLIGKLDMLRIELPKCGRKQPATVICSYQLCTDEVIE